MSGFPSRFRHLLLSTRAGPPSGAALAVAQAWAGRLGARLATLAVRPAPGGAAGGVGVGGLDPDRSGHATAVREGIPAVEIVQFAESIMADLIVMVSPPDAEAHRAELVEHYDAVVRRSEVPCLILPAGQSGVGRVRVALDGSERGMRALWAAWGLRKFSPGGFSAIHVAVGAAGAPQAIPPGEETTVLRLGGWIQEMVKPDLPPALIYRQGDLVTEVLGGLSAGAADLLVIGVRRGGPVQTAGSTGGGRRILAAARCGILTVPL